MHAPTPFTEINGSVPTERGEAGPLLRHAAAGFGVSRLDPDLEPSAALAAWQGKENHQEGTLPPRGEGTGGLQMQLSKDGPALPHAS